ncbi:MAG: pilus assembly protein PilC [Verrucomicrobiales bacterium]|nr:pilus assembly protein PilC [Verrucomicrobiales bacterium]|tara:strand:+ start:2673 stop:3935 length:1263 start_codon:yes stop_codon:yes gene_type:complete
MPLFSYIAIDKDGKQKEGTLEVTSQNEAISRIKEMGFYPTQVAEVKDTPEEAKKRKEKKGKKKGEIGFALPFVNTKELCMFTRQLAVLIDAGLPLMRGMSTLSKSIPNVYFKGVINDIGETIGGGSTFSEALAKHPKIFDKLYINMVKAGEIGGVLEIALNRLAEFQEKAESIKGKVKSAMFYPVAVMIVATIIVGILMTFVIPKFKAIFADMLGDGETLPGFTMLVLNISDAIRNNVVAVIGGVFAFFIVFKLIVGKTKAGRWAWDKLKLLLPALGPLVRKVAIARFARTLGTLISSGVPILQALSIVKETAGNVHLSNAIDKVYDAVKEGETITKPLEASGIFPPMVVSMIDIGEETGALPEMLVKVADVYEEEVDNAVSALTSLLEPVMICFLAVVVGSIVIAMFLPLIKMMDKLGS